MLAGSHEWIDFSAVVVNGEMHVGKFRPAREADQPERLTALHGVAGFHKHAASPKMAVLRLPAVAVIDQHVVARFTAPDRINTDLANAHVVHVVADRTHRAGGCGD